MKKVLSVFLALMLAVSLFSVVGVSALADEDEQESAVILFTGGVGSAVGGEGLNFASVAALKASYEDALLVDAGGFEASAASVMKAAGYDLVVPAAALEDGPAAISMGVEGLSAGCLVTKNGISIAFVGVAPMGGQEAEAYYEAIQNNVDAIEADYVVALGQVDDAAALAANVSGVNAILTYGDATDKAVVEAAGETQAAAVTVGRGFAAVGILELTKDENGIVNATVTTLNGEEFAALELTADEDVAALEAAWAEEAEAAAAAALDDAETPDENEEQDGDGDGEAAAEPDTDTAADGDGQLVEAGEPGDDTEPDELKAGIEEQTAGESSSPYDAEVTVNEPQTSQNNANEQAVSPLDATTNEENNGEGGEDDPATPTPIPTETPPDTGVSLTEEVQFEKNSHDLVFERNYPIKSITVNGQLQYEGEGKDYILTNGGKTATFAAGFFNNWGNGLYNFVFSYTEDGVEDETVKVTISGDAPAATDTPVQTAEPTATVAPTAAPTATPVPTSSGDTPATGDSSPIALYVVILVVMVAALAVVIYLVVRKNKRK